MCVCVCVCVCFQKRRRVHDVGKFQRDAGILKGGPNDVMWRSTPRSSSCSQLVAEMSKAASLLCTTGPAARRQGWSSPVAAVPRSPADCVSARLHPSCVWSVRRHVSLYLCLSISSSRMHSQQRLTLREQALTWQRWSADCTSPCQIDSEQPAIRALSPCPRTILQK
jgi:hypothetical protein